MATDIETRLDPDGSVWQRIGSGVWKRVSPLVSMGEVRRVNDGSVMDQPGTGPCAVCGSQVPRSVWLFERPDAHIRITVHEDCLLGAVLGEDLAQEALRLRNADVARELNDEVRELIG